jgi:hypothetical protein
METIKERTAGHTPLPWIVNGDKFQVEHWPTSFSGDHRVIALCATGDGAMANAMLIVKAVNSFPALVEALKAIIACDDDHEVFDTFGLADSTDNNGNPYPSQHLADVLAKARTALSEAAVVEDTGEGRATLDEGK